MLSKDEVDGKIRGILTAAYWNSKIEPVRMCLNKSNESIFQKPNQRNYTVSQKN